MQHLSKTRFTSLLDENQLLVLEGTFSIRQIFFTAKSSIDDTSDNVYFGLELRSPNGSAPHYSQVIEVK